MWRNKFIPNCNVKDSIGSACGEEDLLSRVQSALRAGVTDGSSFGGILVVGCCLLVRLQNEQIKINYS